MVAPFPLVSLARHAAPSTWTRSQRAALARDLAAQGIGLTECSDTRERLGLPRLSESTPEQRARVIRDLTNPSFRDALDRVRTLRASLLEGLEACDAEIVGQARALLGLRTTSQLRLNELAALYAQTRILEIAAEPARTIRPANPAPYVDEVDLFAARGGV
jgi:hypothetical protein